MKLSRQEAIEQAMLNAVKSVGAKKIKQSSLLLSNFERQLVEISIDIQIAA